MTIFCITISQHLCHLQSDYPNALNSGHSKVIFEWMLWTKCGDLRQTKCTLYKQIEPCKPLFWETCKTVAPGGGRQHLWGWRCRRGWAAASAACRDPHTLPCARPARPARPARAAAPSPPRRCPRWTCRCSRSRLRQQRFTQTMRKAPNVSVTRQSYDAYFNCDTSEKDSLFSLSL